MGILEAFRARKKITASDARIERVRLEQREKRLSAEIESLGKEKEELFRKGAETTSKALRTIYARKFEESTKRMAIAERESARLSKEVRVVTALVHVLERAPRPGSERLLARLSDRQVAEIVKLVDSDDVRGEYLSERLDEILGLMEAGESKGEPVGEEGKEILRVWEKMDEGGMELEEGLKKAEEESRKKAKEAQ